MSKPDFSTAPKPFVFVLMPFKDDFDDIYEFGIKGAADEAGAFAQRVDEQDYVESTLDRILNQINKADVIVADMTGKNPNVFYEVGYAHAQEKLVLLVAQNIEDIPFDLKHRPHIIYAGQIQTLKERLTSKIKWAIAESQRATRSANQRVLLDVNLFGTPLPETNAGAGVPHLFGTTSGREFSLPLLIRNASSDLSPQITYIYLVFKPTSKIYPVKWETETYPPIGTNAWMIPSTKQVAQRMRSVSVPGTTSSEVQARLNLQVPTLPTDALEEAQIEFQIEANIEKATEPFKLRFHSTAGTFEYRFMLSIEYQKPAPDLFTSLIDKETSNS